MASTVAFHARVRGSVPGLGGLKETKLFLPHPRVKVSIVGSLRDREVACSASDRQSSNFESCVWRTVSSQSSHHPQEVLLAQFSLYVHKGGLKPDSFHFISSQSKTCNMCNRFGNIRVNNLTNFKMLPPNRRSFIELCIIYMKRCNNYWVNKVNKGQNITSKIFYACFSCHHAVNMHLHVISILQHLS